MPLNISPRKSEAMNNAPFILPVESAPIIPMEWAVKLADAHEKETSTPITSSENMQLRKAYQRELYEILWEIRDNVALQIVKEREIPLYGTRPVLLPYHREEGVLWDHRELYAGYSNDVTVIKMAVSLAEDAREKRKPFQQTLDEFNYGMYVDGMASILREQVGHDGMRNARRLADGFDTYLINDSEDLSDAKHRHQQEWRYAFFRYEDLSKGENKDRSR
jgi:hypothetical protein